MYWLSDTHKLSVIIDRQLRNRRGGWLKVRVDGWMDKVVDRWMDGEKDRCM